MATRGYPVGGTLLTLCDTDITNIEVANHKLLIINLLFSPEVISKLFLSQYKFLFFFYFHLNKYLLSLILLTQLNYLLSLHMFSNIL